ncbi:MAG: glycosyltransferase family 4 protein [bacterium JZ-2024 1]
MAGDWATFALALGVAAGGSLLLVRWAPALGLMDTPDGIRKTHDLPKPTGGGIPIAFAFMTGLLLSGRVVPRWFMFAGAGALIVLVMGIADDRFPLRASTKLAIQVLATAIALIPFLGLAEPSAGFARNLAILAMLALFVLTITNGYNLIDGVDGLSGSLGMLSATLLLVFNAVFSRAPQGFQVDSNAGLLAFSVLGFLLFNLPPARLFLGDSGSHFIGFLLAILWLPFVATSHLGGVAAVSANLFPVADVVYSVWRRGRAGKPIFQPDRAHLHFLLLDHFRNASVVILMCVIWTSVTFAIMTYLKGAIGE